MAKVLENIKDYNLISEGDNILIGLSGGPDSVYLFYKLLEAREHIDFALHIAHINHGVRGKEADQDQAFVEALAKRYSIPFYSKKENMDDLARKEKISAEEAGRRIRHGFFKEILKSVGGGKIALGHNKSDQVETIIMRFFRGTGLDGLKGMDFADGNIIRPILNIDRSEIEGFLDENKLEYKIDKTNLESIYMRNRTRLELIPYIEEYYNPNLIDLIFKNSFLFKEDAEFLNNYSKEKYKEILVSAEKNKISLNRSELKKLDLSISSRILRIAFKTVKGDLQGITREHISQSLDLIGEEGRERYLNIIDDIVLAVSYNNIVIGRQESLEEEEVALGKITYDILDLQEYKKLGKLEKNIRCFDYDKIHGQLYLRNRQAGDVFKPLGMMGSKKLKDFFIDEKVPRHKRNQVQLLCDEKNIIWLVGYRISDLYKIDKQTKKVIKVKVEGGYYGE